MQNSGSRRYFNLLIFVLLVTAVDISTAGVTPRDRVKEAISRQLEFPTLAHNVAERFGEMNPAIATRIVGESAINGHLAALPEMCHAHVQQEVDKLTKGGYRKDDWMAHVASCECCGPLIKEIWTDYVLNVSELPHVVVFFDNNSLQIKPEYRSALDDFYRAHLNSTKLRAFLIGRASPIGDVRSNQALSERRAQVVNRYLTELGAASDRLDYRFFGQDPPSLDETILGIYDVPSKDYRSVTTRCESRNADLCRMNQSVVVVAY